LPQYLDHHPCETMDKAKSYFACFSFFDGETNEDELNRLTQELEDTKTKLSEARRELSRMRLEQSHTATNSGEPPIPSNGASFINNGSNQSSASGNSNSLRNMTRPMPNFSYSEANTLVVHDSAKQLSALEKLEEKVMEKMQQKQKHNYEILHDTEPFSDDETHENVHIQLIDEASDDFNEIYQQEINKQREKIIELEHEMDKLSLKIKETERDKDSLLKQKDDEIAKLKKEIKELKEAQAVTPSTSLNQSGSGANGLGTSFSLSLNQDIMDMHNNNSSANETDDDQKTTTSSKLSVKKKSQKHRHYDNISEQIEILNNEDLKNKSLSLCLEQERISKSGSDKGIIMFFTKYLKQKTVDQIFSKSGKTQKSDPNYISSASGLVNVLSFATILYKVKAYQVIHSDKRPKIDNADIKNTVKYLSIWIVRSHGVKTGNTYYDNKTNKEYPFYSIKISKQDFSKAITQYLKEFVDKKGTHIDSIL